MEGGEYGYNWGVDRMLPAVRADIAGIVEPSQRWLTNFPGLDT